MGRQLVDPSVPTRMRLVCGHTQKREGILVGTVPYQQERPPPNNKGGAAYMYRSTRIVDLFDERSGNIIVFNPVTAETLASRSL